eukprot:6399796-Amphidinium_carterae.2
MAPKRSQSDGPHGRHSRPGPPFIPGVSYSIDELAAASEEQEARNERARKQFLDRSLRDARPTPPATPSMSAGEAYTANAAVAETTTGPIPDAAATVQTSVVSHIEAAAPASTMPTAPNTAESDVHATSATVQDPEPEPEMSYMQQALNILQAPFRSNKKRAHSGSSSEVLPSPRTHIQQQREQTADQDQNMEGNVDEPTAESTTAEDESSKRPKTESDRLYKEQEDKRAAEQQEREKRLPDKLPTARNTTVIHEDAATQGSHDTAGGTGSGAQFYCPCCPGWFFTPQKRYLHLALQHTVLLPQLGGKMQDDFASEGLYVIPLLQPPTIRGGPRVFAGTREVTAYRSAVKNVSKIQRWADRNRLWKSGVVPDEWEVPQHMDLPQTEPPNLQLAEFWGADSIKLKHSGDVIENRELLLRSEYRTDHGKLNSWERYRQSKMEWGRRSADGDWAEPDPRDRRYWTFPPYQSPFGGKGKGNTAGDGYGGEWVERPHYSNWTYRPNEGKDGKGQKGKNTASDQMEATGDPTADSSSPAHNPPPRQAAHGAHSDTAATEAPQPKPMPRMTRVVPTAGGSAILPAEALEDDDIDAEIEAAKQASLQQLPYMVRVNTILDTDSPTTVFSKAFAGFETMEQTEIDATLSALQDHVSDDTMAKVIQVVDEQVIPAKWAPPEQEQNTADLETSRKS